MLRNRKRFREEASSDEIDFWNRAETHGTRAPFEALPKGGFNPPRPVPGLTFVYRSTTGTTRDASQALITSPNGITFHRILRMIPVFTLRKGSWTRIGQTDDWRSGDMVKTCSDKFYTCLVPRHFLNQEFSADLLGRYLKTWPLALVDIVRTFLYTRDPEELFLLTNIE